MKRISKFMILLCAGILLAATSDSQAASARVRCRVEPGRVKIQVDGLDLTKGTYGARVKNARTGSIVKTEAKKVKTVTAGIDDIDLDFDTEAGPADKDSFVPATFVKVGDTVRASVVKISSGVTVAAASTTCVAK